MPIKKPSENVLTPEQPEITTEVLSRPDLYKAVEEILQLTRKHAHLFILLQGDRLSCCDQGLAVYQDQKISSLATISPFGEEYTGQPAIVSLYTLPEKRRQGLGTLAISKAIDLCDSRGLTPVEVSIISSHAKGLIDKLPAELLEKIIAKDLTASGLDISQLPDFK